MIAYVNVVVGSSRNPRTRRAVLSIALPTRPPKIHMPTRISRGIDMRNSTVSQPMMRTATEGLPFPGAGMGVISMRAA